MTRSNVALSFMASLLVLGASAASIRAEALADFSGGLGKSMPNQFPGKAGQGWSDGWQASYLRNNGEGLSIDVKEDAAFKESPMVLVVSRQSGAGSVRLARTLDSAAVNPESDHVITFQIRADEFTGSSSQPFVFSIGGFNQSVRSQSPTDSVWALGISKKMTWGIYQSNENGGVVLHQTDVPMEFGSVYSITVRVFPSEKTFQIRIDSSSHGYESPRLSSPNPKARSETISLAGWVTGNGPGNFRWSLGPIRIHPSEAGAPVSK